MSTPWVSKWRERFVKPPPSKPTPKEYTVDRPELAFAGAIIALCNIAAARCGAREIVLAGSRIQKLQERIAEALISKGNIGLSDLRNLYSDQGVEFHEPAPDDSLSLLTARPGANN